MLAHCVFLNFSDAYSSDERMEVLRALGGLKDEVDGIVGYSYGPNRDFEGKSLDHNEGFIVTFRDRQAHLDYERHPRHVELGGRLVAMCVGGVDGIVVYDLEI
jgi:hypothetical protein